MPIQLNILVIDDHPVVRSGLISILQRSFEESHFGEAQDHNSAKQEIVKCSWDIILLDLSLPDINGLDLLQVIKKNCASARVLVLSIFPEDQFGLRAVQAGADGYLSKEAAPEKLVTAVSTLLDGKRYLSNEHTTNLRTSSTRLQSGLENLSTRELSVMRLLYQGIMVKEIAAKLELSPKTISTYRYRVLEKLKLNSNAELIQFVMRNNLFP